MFALSIARATYFGRDRSLVSRRAINDELYIFMRYFLRVYVQRALAGLYATSYSFHDNTETLKEPRQSNVSIGRAATAGGEFFRRILRNESESLSLRRMPGSSFNVSSKFLFHRQSKREDGATASPGVYSRERECNSNAGILGRMREAPTKDPLAPRQRALPDDH